MTDLRIAVEDFLYYEADLLDSWALSEWLALFVPESKYLVPSLDHPEMSSTQSLYLIMDDYRRLSSRVNQYLGGHVWAETPFSRVRRHVTNVRVLSENDKILVKANFSVHRFYQGNADLYVGQYHYQLLNGGKAGFQILEKKAVLDMDVLRPQSKLSILL
jgi:p-cumate 2,3-dioxygenase beta subunit